MMRGIPGLVLFITLSCVEQQPEGAGEEGKIQITWDFTYQSQFEYSYEQSIAGYYQTKRAVPASHMELIGKGVLTVYRTYDSLTELRMTDLETTSLKHGPDGVPAVTSIKNYPSGGVPSITPPTNLHQPMKLGLSERLFPLPPNPMAMGDSVVVPIEMPFDINGYTGLATGRYVLTFVSFEKISGRQYAVLQGRLALSNSEVPKDFNGQYFFAMKGTSTHWYDHVA